MNTYLVMNLTYMETAVNFKCFFKIKPSTKYQNDSHDPVYKITDVLYSNPKYVHIKIEGNYYGWIWNDKDEEDIIRDGVYDQNDGDRLIEFEDNNSALLWFKLTY